MYNQLNKKKSKKPIWISIGIIAILAVIAVGIFVFIHYKNSALREATSAAESFTTHLKEQNYEKLKQDVNSSELKKVAFTKKEMVAKYQAVYGGIGAKNIKISKVTVKQVKGKSKFKLTYDLNMTTDLGKLKTKHYSAMLTQQDDKWKVNWQPDLIFPNMVKSDKVLFSTDDATRGDIVDRNGKKLATMSHVEQYGVIPEKLGSGSKKEANIKAISKVLDVETSFVKEQLSQKWVKSDSFVPLKKWLSKKKPKSLSGLTSSAIPIRTYPLNKAAAQLIGYVGEVSADDIKKNKTLKAGDIIGKTGLERYFDKKLRGKNGGTIKIVNSQTKNEEILQKVTKQDGKTIKLTIDSAIQQKAFTSLGKETGQATMINPKNGDLLALVSTPSFDANQMTAGISSKDYQKLANNKDLPFLARYATRYAPGSTFKTLTAAIGLDLGVTKPNKVRKISGLKWQKNSSWGKYFVTRVHDVSSVNMTDALVYSDNIYFAQEGLEIGAKRLEAGLKKFNFAKEYKNLPFTMEPGQIANKKGISSEVLLADTSYGQGQLLLSSVQQAVAYSAIANNGKIPEPRLVMSDKSAPLKHAVKASSAQKVKNALVKAVSDSGGTSHTLEISGEKLAAKTGTAELKQKQGESGKENGFLYTFDADNPNFLFVGMIEDVNGRGGSGLVIKQMKPLIESMFK